MAEPQKRRPKKKAKKGRGHRRFMPARKEPKVPGLNARTSNNLDAEMDRQVRLPYT
jgi:hypothetical protein